MLVFTWISALASKHFPITVIGATRYEGALTVSIYCITFLLVSAYGKATKGLLFVFATSTFLMSALSVAQLHGANPFTLFPSGYNYFDAGKAYGGAYLGTIGNIDIVAAFYSIAIPILLISFFRLKEKTRWLLLLPIATSLYVFFKMFVLAGVVGLLAGAVISLPIILRATKKATAVYSAAALFFVCIFLLVLYFKDIGGGFLHELHSLLRGNADGSFGSGRMHIWQLIAQRIPSHFFLGVGPDTMGLENIEAFSRYDEVFGVQLISNIDVAHSEYLNVLYHQGIFALMSYLSILACTIVKWLKSKNNFAAVMLGSAVVCYALQACFSFSMCITAPYFWTALALLEKESQNV